MPDDSRSFVDKAKDFLFGAGPLKKAANPDQATVTPAQDSSYLQKAVQDYMQYKKDHPEQAQPGGQSTSPIPRYRTSQPK